MIQTSNILSYFYVMLGIAFFVSAFIMFCVIKKCFAFRTLEQYKAKFPHCVRGNSIVCCKCGSDMVISERVDGTMFSITHTHCCMQCGTELYRTSSSFDQQNGDGNAEHYGQSGKLKSY